jgi:hypothetical protein
MEESSRDPRDKRPAADFERQAEQRSSGLIGELFGFLLDSRKWWLAPILLALLVIGALAVLAQTAAAPFIYTLF